jgi:adenosylcobinamide-GDP ribazoletransferase
MAGVLAGLVPFWWARRRLGGVSGDVMGAANELARLVALHAGVIAWTRL